MPTRIYPVEEIQNATPLYAKNARFYGRFSHVFEFKTDSGGIQENSEKIQMNS